MKKILLPILSLILAACSSSQVAVTRSAQVTVTSPPTATPIPTPTLHPQFVKLQSQIAASGETFTLLSDGTIEQTTSEGTIIVPGLSVDKNGAITLQGDSSQVTISPESLSFDDEKGVNVAGYTLDEANGLWGVEITPEDQLSADMENWNMTADKYNVGYDKEGKIELREKGSNRLVYWDGRWSSDVIVNMAIATNDCQVTPYVSLPERNSVQSEQVDDFESYVFKMSKAALQEADFGEYLMPFRAEPLKDTENCWGVWTGSGGHFNESIFAWRDKEEKIQFEFVFHPK